MRSGSPDFCKGGGSLTGSLKTHPVVGATPETSRSQPGNGFSGLRREGWVINPSLGFLRGLLLFMGPLSLWLEGEGLGWGNKLGLGENLEDLQAFLANACVTT